MSKEMERSQSAFSHQTSNDKQGIVLATESPLRTLELARHNNLIKFEQKRCKTIGNFMKGRRNLVKEIHQEHQVKLKAGQTWRKVEENKKRSWVKYQNHIKQTTQRTFPSAIYLSNIVNLEDIRKSISFSRACFARKRIIFDRELSKPYTPFLDEMPHRVSSTTKNSFAINAK